MTHRIPAGSPRLLRRLNAAAVLRTIRADGPISRAELARVTGLSKPTVNGAVELLLESGYLTERVAGLDAATRRPGPRARLLSFRGDLGHVLGIDIGANKVLVVVADLTGEVIGSVRRRTSARDRQTADTLLDLVGAATDEVLATRRRSTGAACRRSVSARPASSTLYRAGSRWRPSSAAGRGSGSRAGWSRRSPARCSSTTRCISRSWPSAGVAPRRGSTTPSTSRSASASAAAS